MSGENSNTSVPITGERYPQENNNSRVKSAIKPLGDVYAKFLDRLDSLGISPNRLVTIRTGTSLSIAAIMAGSDNLGTPIEWSLFILGVISLLADRIDGDLARHTDQCSKTGEILDAGFDKVVVFGSLAVMIYNLPPEVSDNIKYWMLGATGLAATLDTISQSMRGTKNNLEALMSCWKTPLAPEEREANKAIPKTANAANWYGKLKTTAIMSGLGIGLEEVSSLEPDTRGVISATLISLSVLLSAASLGQKFYNNTKES